MATFSTGINPTVSDTYSLGNSSKKWKLNGAVAEILVISVSATSNTSSSVSNSSITARHVVLNDTQLAAANISWTTAAGSLSLSGTGAIPAMTLYLAVSDA